MRNQWIFIGLMSFFQLANLFCGPSSWAQEIPAFSPPAVPLVVHDPYFSIWSRAEKLSDGPTRHWTGKLHEIFCMVRVDGISYRLSGVWSPNKWPAKYEALPQTAMELTPTQTIYTFEGAGIRLKWTFLSPMLPHDLDLVSRPVTYLNWEVSSLDGQAHEVQIYLDAAAEIAVQNDYQPVQTGRFQIDQTQVLRVGTVEQPILEKAGDKVCIDWGYLYLAVPSQEDATTIIGNTLSTRLPFAEAGRFPKGDRIDGPIRPNVERRREATPVLAAHMELTVSTVPQSRWLMLAYDDVYSIEYFHRKLRPYWNRHEIGISGLLQTAEAEYDSLVSVCTAFDQALMEDLHITGGEKYKRMAVLAYRQTLAAHKLVQDVDGQLLYLSKENHSNGSIGTVDVTYPSAPFFLLLNPTLLKAMLTPIFDYARSGRWRFEFAPHDLGKYPQANGQKYGGGEISAQNQMPIEECGNMLIMAAAIAKAEGNADYASEHWDMISQWAAYLLEKGLDPDNQLSTDDFTGHLAHNANLSLKAILAIRAYAYLCELRGEDQARENYQAQSEQMTKEWVRLADDGDHYRLAFDKPGTWSQKYNLVWDLLLDFGLFPKQVIQTELAWYQKQQLPYGLPLDNRSTFTKLDWIFWTATLADEQAQFESFVDPVYRFVQETSDDHPLTDWYWAHDGTWRGFTARSVVGGIYIKMLKDQEMWQKWSPK